MSWSDVSTPMDRHAFTEVPWSQADADLWEHMPWAILEEEYRQNPPVSGSERSFFWSLWRALRWDPRTYEAHQATERLVEEAWRKNRSLDEVLYRLLDIADGMAQHLSRERQADPAEALASQRLLLKRAHCLTAAIAVRYLRRDAWTDPVTRVGNRWAIQHQLRQLTGFAHPFRIDFVDVDHFKQVNDQWGHWTGDVVLRALAQTWIQRLPRGSWLGRWGGDEFLVITSGEGLSNAPAAILTQPVTVANGAHLRVTIKASVGSAEYPRDGQTASLLIQKADQRLYAAKRSRRASWPAPAEDNAKGATP
ncbi:MAG: GGDEF domain-containing protein [Firmicutes bacterium]|nr:GGDEF domain-containing protein [Bacillota bacterium]